MNAKEKAKDIFDKMVDNYYTDTALVEINRRQAKKCTKIAVEEIINTFSPYGADNNARVYWREVLKEIDLL